MIKPIIIENFQLGIADSPHNGFADMRNVIVDKENGIVEIGWKTTQATAIAEDRIIKWIIQNEVTPAQFYAIDDTGRVFRSTNSGSDWNQIADRAGFGEGMEIWKDYLFVTTNTATDVYGPLSGSPVWASFVSFSSGDSSYHPIIKGKDDILYLGDGRYIASLQEVSGTNFDTTSTTYVFTNQALDLAEDYKIKCLEELGNKLMVGSYKGSFTNLVKSADIFPWDRTSDSFDLPIKFDNFGVHAIKTINNLIYILSGIKGEIFITDGSSVKLLNQIPDYSVQLTGGKQIQIYPGAIINHRNKLFFGISSSGSGGQEITDGVGVWSVDLETNRLIFENQISRNTTGGAAPNDVQITALASVDNNSYLIGWSDGSNFGIDKISNTQRYTSYAARIDSQFYSVGTKDNPVSFSNLSFELTKPLATGEGIRFSRRTDLSANFTGTTTIDFTDFGAIQNGNTDFKFTTEGGLQIRIEMTTGAASATTPKLKKVVLT